jgi:MFS family permease
MRSGGAIRLSPFATLIVLAVVNHAAHNGSRVTVSLDALRRGESPVVVGALMACYALLPMLLAVVAGRYADRVGVRRPMQRGSLGLMLALLVASASPWFYALFATAAVAGGSFMMFQLASQYAAGEMGSADARVKNFGLLALGYSTSSALGPLVAGFMIDHIGFKGTYLVLAALPLASLIVLAKIPLPLPGPHPAHAAHRRGNPLELASDPNLRRPFVIAALIAMAWELHTIFLPIYGSSIGLSASSIGLIFAAFAAATFLVRLVTPLIMGRMTEYQVLTAALFACAAVYFAFPLLTSAGTLMIVAFCLGLSVGTGQPMVMSLLHHHAPPGRMGEAAGVRIAMINLIAVGVPLLFGAVASAVGLAPVLWSAGASLALGGWLTRARERS